MNERTLSYGVRHMCRCTKCINRVTCIFNGACDSATKAQQCMDEAAETGNIRLLDIARAHADNARRDNGNE